MKDEEFLKIKELYEIENSKRYTKNKILDALDIEIKEISKILSDDSYDHMEMKGNSKEFDTSKFFFSAESEFKISINFPLIFKKYLVDYLSELKMIRNEIAQKED